MRGTQITATRKNKEVTRNMEKWKILKKRPSHLSNLTANRSHIAEQSDSDDDFDLPGTSSATQQRPPPEIPTTWLYKTILRR